MLSTISQRYRFVRQETLKLQHMAQHPYPWTSPPSQITSINNLLAGSESELLLHCASGDDGLPEGVGAEAADQNHLLSGKPQCQNSLTRKCTSHLLWIAWFVAFAPRSFHPALALPLACLMLCCVSAGNRTHGHCRTFAASQRHT